MSQLMFPKFNLNEDNYLRDVGRFRSQIIPKVAISFFSRRYFLNLAPTSRFWEGAFRGENSGDDLRFLSPNQIVVSLN